MTIQKDNSNTAEWKEHSPAPESVQSNVLNLIRNVTNFASLLRICGGMIMLVAMSSYLMQGWSDGNDISRYYMLLSQTFLLALSGFGLSYVLKENKGARIFFGLSLISITVNMTTLGALIFSTTQWGSELVQYPGFAKWDAPEFGVIIITLSGTVAISAPITWVGHKVLARRSAGTLSTLFLFTNLLLLLPVRESVFVGIAAFIAVIIPLILFRKRMLKDNTLRTPEGLFAMATVLVPAGVIICRSIWLYPVDEILQIILAVTAFITLRFCAQQTEEGSYARILTHWLSTGAALGIAIPTAGLADHYLSEPLALNVFGFVFAGLLLEISGRCQKPVAPIRLAAIVLMICHILPVMFTDNIFNAVLCLLAGLAVITVARQHGLRYLMISGMLTLPVGFGRQVLNLTEWIDFSSQITLSVSGGIIIITASLIERHGAVIKMKWDRLAKPIQK